jgi:hypothetical protein
MKFIKQAQNNHKEFTDQKGQYNVYKKPEALLYSVE